MKLYFILIEAACMISTTVIMIIITIAICVFSALLFSFSFLYLSLQMKFCPKDYEKHLLYSGCKG